MKTDRNVKQYATGTDVAYMIGEKKWCHKLVTIILSNLNRFLKKKSLEDSLINLQLNGY